MNIDYSLRLRRVTTPLVVGLLSVSPIACSGPDISNARFQCASSVDCLDGFVCASRAGICVAPATDVPGVSASEIAIGYTGALTEGPTEIGLSMRNGIEAYFESVNAAGGIDGRTITLTARDDAGDSDRADQNARDLILSGDVFALLGPGNPRAAGSVADIASEAKTLIIGPRSGLPSLHDPAPRYVFNTRASFSDEISEVVAYMVGSRDILAAPQNIAVFAEGTSVEGTLSEQAQSLFTLASAALDDGSVTPPTPRLLQHRLDIVDVDGPVGAGLKWLAESDRRPNANGEKVGAVLLASTGAPTQAFVVSFLDVFHRIRRGDAPDSIYGLTPEEISSIQTISEVFFWAPSSLNIDAAAKALRLSGTFTTLGGEVSYCRQVLTTAIAPPTTASSTGFVNFRQRMTDYDPAATQDRVAFEGYVAAQVLVEALLQQGPKTDTEGLVDILESFTALELDTGTLSFSPTDHTGSETIFPARLTDDCGFEEFDINNLVPPVGGDGCVEDTCELRGIIVDNKDLTADKIWILNGTVFVGDGVNPVVLNIEPGTLILGANGDPSDDDDSVIESAPGVLVIRPNARLVADGTQQAPIVFTSEKPVGERSTGDWGGIVINGNAPTNACVTGNCPPLGEGGSGYYGGQNVGDNSGILRYVRVEYAGLLVNDENELNGIAFQGVGNGTVVDYLQVHRGKDDGIEFFGGTVDVKHLMVTCADDDSLDWTQGWVGRGQHILVRQCAGHGDNGIEADNNGTLVDTNADGEADTAVYRDASPRSHPILSNVTLVGVPDDENSDYGMLLREGTGAEIHNAIVMGFNDACINIDHQETFANAVTTTTAPFSLSGELMMRNSFVDCVTPFEDDGADLFSITDWATTLPFQAAPTNNQVGSAGLRDPHNDSGPNFRLTGGSSAISGAEQPSGEFFDPVTYIGAVDTVTDWTAGWTTFEGDVCDGASPPARCQ